MPTSDNPFHQYVADYLTSNANTYVAPMVLSGSPSFTPSTITKINQTMPVLGTLQMSDESLRDIFGFFSLPDEAELEAFECNKHDLLALWEQLQHS